MMQLFKQKIVGKEVEKEEVKFQVVSEQKIAQIPEIDDKTKVDLRYGLIVPYAYVHIYWDEGHGELVYYLEEPSLDDKEKETLNVLEEGIREFINMSFINVSEKGTLIEYLEKNVRVLLKELGIKLDKNSYLKIMYYIYRDFIGLNRIEPLMNDYYIEDIECNGRNTPVYIVHRKFGNLRTNITYEDFDELKDFVAKLSQKCGRYISYGSPMVDGQLPSGDRVNATYTEDVTSRGPTFCITGGYIQLSNGNVKKIDKLFEEVKNNFGCKLENGNEVVDIININCCGVDEKDLSQKDSKIKTIIKLAPPEKLVEVKLSDGTEIITTTNHLFHVADNELKLIEAEKLEKGFFIPVPTKINVQGCTQKINIHNLLKEFSYIHKICIAANTNIKEIVLNEINSYSNRKQISEEYSVGNSYFYEVISRGNSVSFEILEKVCEKQNIGFNDLNGIAVVVYGGGTKDKSKAIKIPAEIDEDLAYLAGAIISDGHLSKANIDISTFEEGFRVSVIQKLTKEFGWYDEYYNGNRIYLCNILVPYYFNKVFEIPFGKKARTVKVPEVIFKSDNKVISSFLRGLFDGDGTCKSGLSYKTYSKELVYGISYLLARLGIYCYIRQNNEEFKLNIPSIYERTFAEMIGFDNRGKLKDIEALLKKRNYESKTFIRHGRVPSKPVLDLLKDLNISKSKITKECKVSYDRLLYYDTISKPFAKKILNFIEKNYDPNIDYIKWLINCNQEFVRVSDVKVIDNIENKPVYDIELEPCKFFIAGDKPMNIFDTIRKFTKIPWSPIKLMEMGTVSAELLAYLWLLIEHGSNILIVGGTGSGKTTLLNNIAFFIPDQARIVSIEDTRELQLIHENWLPSVARAGVGLGEGGVKPGEVTMFDLLKGSFRQRPDYVIVGEVRGAEANVLMQGAAAGHPSISTIHADDVATVIRRLMTPPISLSPALIESLDAAVLIGHATIKGKDVRKVKAVEEIIKIAADGRAELNVPFRWDPRSNTFQFKRESYVFEKIIRKKGISREELNREFDLRTRLLLKMYQEKISEFEEVQKVIHAYYKVPYQVLLRFGLK